MRYTVIVGDETVEVTFERTASGIEATIQDRSYSVEVSSVEPGSYCLNWNHKSIEAFVLPNGDAYSASIGSHRIPVEIQDARKKLKRRAQRGPIGEAEIRAPMPGKIVRVLVGEGMNVELNQGIVVMEAMKMQNEIKTPMQGKLQKLAVAEGSTVRSGELIAIVS